jgi:Fic family protein
VHFEAPPAQVVNKEMEEFIIWFNNSSLSGTNPLPILTRASIAHLYFESIHPFEDGNGRIGRAIAEKALSQSLNQPTLIALATIIEKGKKAYYTALEQATRSHDITKWIDYFSSTILEAQNYTLQHIEFLIKKTKFYEAHKNCLNKRQEKVIERILREGPKGFNGGLSAENYIAISNTSRATATRDLRQLLEQNILTKKGERKYTRYYLVLPA